MTLADFFAAQVEREARISRRVLERVPEGRPDWKPHHKSMALGYLATLVATMPSWIAMAIEQDELDLNPPGGAKQAPPWKTTADLTRQLEAASAQARGALSRTTDAFLMTPWRLLVSGNVVLESPRHVVIADTLAHMAHHRGQLTVYMRLNDAPVPSVYGPSADDRAF
ncbi:MAG TPA: DinB family protein [Vicinamibacteria bacterium]|nr:DinB family protein [Vicinamibacteria bacterium]